MTDELLYQYKTAPMLKNLVFCLQIEPNSYELGFFVVTCDVRENSIHSGK